VYLDHAASTPVDEVAAERAAAVARAPANPSSVHGPGVRATREVERARVRIADALGAAPEEILFTSGASEANNWAVKGLFLKPATRVIPRILVSAVEHPSVLEPARWLHDAGFARLTILPVDEEGRVRLGDLAETLDTDCALVSVQHANNETGAVQPIADIGRLCRAAGALLHVDATQGFQKIPLDLSACPIDLLTASGHKLHGPKGVGLLYVREGVALPPLLHGGGHERGLRGGTLNAPAIAGFGEAVARYTPTEAARVAERQARFEAGLRARFPSVRIHAANGPRIPSITNFAIPGRPGKATFLELDRRGIAVSASSACHSTALTPSHVLKAMGQSDEAANEALRVSFGRTTTEDDVDAILAALTAIHEGGTCP
jgi:cysteine desulfurase